MTFKGAAALGAGVLCAVIASCSGQPPAPAGPAGTASKPVLTWFQGGGVA